MPTYINTTLPLYFLCTFARSKHYVCSWPDVFRFDVCHTMTEYSVENVMIIPRYTRTLVRINTAPYYWSHGSPFPVYMHILRNLWALHIKSTIRSFLAGQPVDSENPTKCGLLGTRLRDQQSWGYSIATEIIMSYHNVLVFYVERLQPTNQSR